MFVRKKKLNAFYIGRCSLRASAPIKIRLLAFPRLQFERTRAWGIISPAKRTDAETEVRRRLNEILKKDLTQLGTSFAQRTGVNDPRCQWSSSSPDISDDTILHRNGRRRRSEGLIDKRLTRTRTKASSHLGRDAGRKKIARVSRLSTLLPIIIAKSDRFTARIPVWIPVKTIEKSSTRIHFNVVRLDEIKLQSWCNYRTHTSAIIIITPWLADAWDRNVISMIHRFFTTILHVRIRSITKTIPTIIDCD